MELTFDEAAIKAIAKRALDEKSGARGLRAIVEELMLDAMFEAPSIKGQKMLHITEDMILNATEAKPQLLMAS